MFQDIKISEDFNALFHSETSSYDAINIKILNSASWEARSERIPVTLPLGDYFINKSRQNNFGKIIQKNPVLFCLEISP